MGTSATYHFTNHLVNPSVCINTRVGATFYVHYDGYEEGAAAKLYAMIPHLEGTARGMAIAFARAEDNAEFCDPNHDMGANYKYTIGYNEERQAYMVTVHHDANMDNKWTTSGPQRLDDFINSNNKMIDNADNHWLWDPALCVGRTLTTRKRFIARVDAEIGKALSALASGWTGNASGILSPVARDLSAASGSLPADTLERLDKRLRGAADLIATRLPCDASALV